MLTRRTPSPEDFVRARRRPPTRERQAPGVVSVRDAVLDLQRNAGNRAVAGLMRYTELPQNAQKPDEWDGGQPLRVADDGSMAVAQEGGTGSHDFWAKAALISGASAILKAKGSVVRLNKGSGELKGSAPNGSGRRTLQKVEPENVATKTKGDAMHIWADCGRAARDLTGVSGGTGTKDWTKVKAVYKRNGKQVLTNASDPQEMADEIVKKAFGVDDADKAWEQYGKLPPAKQEALDKKLGINEYAAPSVGGAFTMATGGTPYSGENTWNFHWAGVVMKSGGDTMTLENYAVGIPEEQNTDWEFQMYGQAAKAGQTFHEQHRATKQHGDRPTTMGTREK